MKAKLIKQNDEYYLTCNFQDAGSTKDYGTIGKLSLKNCQAIERGYDLDELVKERFGEAFWHDGDKYFKEGFQKALSILSDKKYTEDNMMEMAGYMFGAHKLSNADGREEAEKYLKTFEVQEWDVEIVMETCSMNIDDLDCDEIVERPKLDANNCIILKRI
jgi:hypothetical protein